ncbi:MAG: hypothetical protein ACOCQR_02955 [bacterium]
MSEWSNSEKQFLKLVNYVFQECDLENIIDLDLFKIFINSDRKHKELIWNILQNRLVDEVSWWKKENLSFD